MPIDQYGSIFSHSIYNWLKFKELEECAAFGQVEVNQTLNSPLH